MKYQIELIRNIDLNLVLSRTEAKKDPHDRAKWHTCRGILSVTGRKFMNWSTGTGGGGAIDLFMHLYQCDFKTALAELWQNFSNIQRPNCMLCYLKTTKNFLYLNEMITTFPGSYPISI